MALKKILQRLILLVFLCVLAAMAGIFSDLWTKPIIGLLNPITVADLFRAEYSRVKNCENLTLSVLKSPATYKRVNAIEAIDILFISFDSQNGYGALIRSQVTCVFDKQGRLDIFQFNKEEMQKVDALGNIVKSAK